MIRRINVKKLLIGLLVLGSFSSFASTDCTYIAIGEAGYRLHLSVEKAMKIVDAEMAKKGFTKKSDEADAKYKVNFWTDIFIGDWNGLDHEVVGDNDATASITRISDNKKLYAESASGTSGLVGGSFRKAKSRVLLQRILKNFPNCSELEVHKTLIK
jgi:hypothetical protein